jgi:hypothetical protein
MQRRFHSALVLTALLTIGSTAAQAQRPIQLGIAAGASIPTSDLADQTDTGYHVTGVAEIAPMLMPFGVRAELMFNQLKIKGSSDNLNVFALSGNAIFGLPGIVISPYLIGGAGYYNSKFTGLSDSSNDLGLNGGVGAKFRLGTLSTFGEIRYHNVFTDGDTDLRLVPITFGILF